MWKDEFEKLWERILEKGEHCACHKDNGQCKLHNKTGREKRLANEKEQEKHFVDECCNPYKINLKDLYKILQKEIV